MVRLSRPGAHEVDILEDGLAGSTQQHLPINANTASSLNHFAALHDLDNNTDRSTPDFIDSLTAKLKDLHIYSPKKSRANRSTSLLSMGSDLNRSSVDPEVFPVLYSVREEAEDGDDIAAAASFAQGPFPAEPPRVTEIDEGSPSSSETLPPAAAATCQTPVSFEANFSSQAGLKHHPLSTDPRVQLSVTRHKAGQYDYVLLLHGPNDSAKRKNPLDDGADPALNFGCNFLVQNEHNGKAVCCQGKSANAFTILATPLEDEELTQVASSLSTEGENMAVAEPVVRLISSTPVGHETLLSKSQAGVAITAVEQELPKETPGTFVEHAKDMNSSSSDEGSVHSRTPSRSTSVSSQSRIEDSVEALDRLEEQLEAVNAATHIRLVTPNRPRRIKTATDESSTTDTTVVRRTGSIPKREQPSGVEAQPTTNEARSAHRKSISTVADKSPEKVSSRRSTISRPSSLLPPKPPVKSTKPPTKPSFELPGEAVARRIKEQREARLAQQTKVSAPTVPQRKRSTKAPTRPNFELPGEAISRRKREEREARIKAQEEEERKRREFKARPIRANLASTSYPRDTATSRARQSRGPEESDGINQLEGSPSKRSSILGTARTLPTRSASTRSPQVRGRGLSQSASSPQASRATSSSTSSTSGKRSVVSAEEFEQQKLKAREVFERDNYYVEDKMRERRERELMAKFAREQAAERSRQASREWAEKQKRKRLSAANGMARQTA